MGLAVFSKNSGCLIGISREITPGGMFISAEDPPRVGDKIILEFALPDQKIPVKAYCEVKSVRKDENLKRGPYGVEVQFLSINENDRVRIEEYSKQKVEVEVDSDAHTLADFINMPDPDLFAKTVPFRGYIEDYKKKGYYMELV